MLDQETPQISVSLVLGSDDLDPDACSEAIGISPTEVWRQKHKSFLNVDTVPNVQWIISTDKIMSYSIDEPLSQLLDLVYVREEEIRRYVADTAVKCVVTCNVTFKGDRPLYEISNRNLERIGRLGASFQMDIFDYSE